MTKGPTGENSKQLNPFGFLSDRSRKPRVVKKRPETATEEAAMALKLKQSISGKPDGVVQANRKPDAVPVLYASDLRDHLLVPGVQARLRRVRARLQSRD